MKYLTILDINPEPWALGKVNTGRKAGGGFTGGLSPDQKLTTYKSALREALELEEFIPFDDETPIELDLYFSRRIEVYRTPSGRLARSHVADATNLQKATEDALQGILFKNDNMVRKVTSTIVNQDAEATPGLIIGYGRYVPDNRVFEFLHRMLAWKKCKTESSHDNSW